ncbi:MAG TPA: alkaline phosphatase [Clostridiaceae bacterium]|nr:alkaline phosphatase [Clostridiaceae bacterium]
MLIAIENIFPPIPSEVILTFGGFMTTYSNLNVWMVILSATVGAVSGALVLYGVGRLIKPEYLKKLLLGKVGKTLHLQPDDIIKARAWFARKGNLTVLFCRFVPIVRSLISIPAGSAKMNLGVFLVFTTIGTAIWNTVLVWLGVLAGESWERIVQYMDTYSTITLLVIAFATFIFGVVFYKRRFKDREEE